MKNKIGIGVIGGGGISAEGHICGYQADPRCEVVALYDVDEAKMGEQGHAALQAGKHVLCEKPMTTMREDAARLVAAVRTTGLVFLGGHVYHFRPDYQAMAAAYRNGELGEVWLAEGDYISDMRPFYGPSSYTPWRTEAKAPLLFLSF